MTVFLGLAYAIQLPFFTVCIRDLDWTLVKVAKWWLFSCYFWQLLLLVTVFGAAQSLPEVQSNHHCLVKLVQIHDTKGTICHQRRTPLDHRLPFTFLTVFVITKFVRIDFGSISFLCPLFQNYNHFCKMFIFYGKKCSKFNFQN